MLFLEREAQLQSLERWHNDITASGGCVVAVTGEAGIGKTSVVREFIHRRGTSIKVLWGACDPLSTPQPLGPLRDVSRQTGGALADALTQGTSRERIFSAMLDELEHARERVVLVMEDMHWADDATLDLLKYLGRRIARTRAMLMVTYRDDEVGARHPLQIAIGHLPGRVLHRLPLSPLSEGAVAELAHDVGRDSAGLHAATAGNPFYVTEVLAAPVSGEVPASVRDTVLARVERLSAEAWKVAELAALVPGRIEAWLIQGVLNAPEAVIEECSSSGMTRDHEGALAFRHELSRRAVEDSLSPLEARSLHARILGVLAADERGVSESRLVHHAVRAGDADAVLRFAPLAAEQATRVGAHREAVAYYRAALAHGDGLESEERARLLDGLAYEFYATDQVEEAINARMRALEIWRTTGNDVRVGDTLRWLSRPYWFLGLSADAERYAMQAVEVLEPHGLHRELAMAYSTVSQMAMLAGQRPRAIEWGERAIEMAKRLGSDDILAHALNNVGAARMERVGDAGWRELEQSLALALRGGYEDHVARAYMNLSSFAIAHRDYPTAMANLEAGIAYCTEREFDVGSRYLIAYRARARFEQASWTDALIDAEYLLSRPESSVPHRLQALTVVGHVRTRRGDESADEPLDKAHVLALGTGEAQRIAPVAAARAELAWLRDDLNEAAREAQAGLASAMPVQNPWMYGELVYWAWRAGAVSRTPTPIADPYQLQLDGDYIGAARLWAALGCPYEEANALADSADESHRRRALEIFEALGARPMARRLRRQLQAEGVRGLKRGANRSTRANPAGLTSRELEILGLLARNLSNAAIAQRLFLSEKTVGHHTSAILAKLDIGSRRDVADAARKLGVMLEE